MLGVRLDPETEQGLNAISQQLGRSKSQIAREAIRSFVSRHDRDARARQEWLDISRAERGDPEVEEILAYGADVLGDE